MGTQKNKILTDSGQTQREMEKLRKQQIQMREELRKMSSESRRLNKSVNKGTSAMKRGFDNASKSAGNLIKSYIGMQAAASAVNRVLEDRKRIQSDAMALTTTIARSHAAVSKNFGGNKSEMQAFLKQVENVHDMVNFGDKPQLNMAAASLLSATGNDTVRTIELLRETAPLFKDAPHQLASFAGSVADIQNATLGSAKEAVALTLGIQGQARITDLASLKNFSPAASNTRTYTAGALDPQQETRISGALFSAIGSQAGDVEGASTGTAVTSLQKKLEQTFPELDGFQDKLKAIRNSSIADKEEFVKSGFEAKSAGAIRELIFDANSETSKRFTEALSKINASPANVDRIKDLLISGTPELQFLDSSKAIKSMADNFLQDSGLASLGAAKELAADTLSKTRASNMASAIMNLANETVALRLPEIINDQPEYQFDALIHKLESRTAQVKNRFGTFGNVDELFRQEHLKLLRESTREIRKLRQQYVTRKSGRSQDEGQ